MTTLVYSVVPPTSVPAASKAEAITGRSYISFTQISTMCALNNKLNNWLACSGSARRECVDAGSR